ncbi:serine protease snk-like [Lycorma delicatula]|uniref:serine protease snk-like n=1 Tax=Lycorma delicatula TaxID=130591 RepID=UPI003F50DA5C
MCAIIVVFSSSIVHECKLFSEFTYSKVNAMPLLPNIYPVKIERKKCLRPNPLIVGGKNATFGEFPHMASVGYRKQGTIRWLCGGSLISEKFVLTAAHCALTKWGKPDVVRLGTVRIDSNFYRDVDVENVITHPNYKPPKIYNDIALLLIKIQIIFNYNIRPACLSITKNLSQLPDPIVIATGWGHVNYGGLSSPNLLKVSLKIVDNEECQKEFSLDSHLPVGINNDMFCAVGYTNLSHDTCQGDSGGPLQRVVEENSCMQQIIGITSFGKYCGSSSPAIYIKVASFISWIETIIMKKEIN